MIQRLVYFAFLAVSGWLGWLVKAWRVEVAEWRREEAEEARRDRARTSREQQR